MINRDLLPLRSGPATVPWPPVPGGKIGTFQKGLSQWSGGRQGGQAPGGRGREERKSLLGRLCFGGPSVRPPYGVKEGLEVVPGYGCLLCQAGELTFLVNHSLLIRSVLSPSHLWARWCEGEGVHTGIEVRPGASQVPVGHLWRRGW